MPPPVTELFRTPFAYVPDEKLVGAVNTALLLGQPLLVTGDPGTGKTQLADFVARWLGLLRPIKYEVKSSTESGDLFYTVDSMRQFRDYNGPHRDKMNPLDYIEFQALGLAILRAADLQKLRDKKDGSFDLLASKMEYTEQDLWPDTAARLTFPHRSVVLIDEVDKAPRDVPNDILNEIELLYFRIPELKRLLGGDDRIKARQDLRPVIIFTSNSETNMPAPFLRRCVYFNIEPIKDKEKLHKIIEGRMFAARVTVGKRLIDDVLELVFSLHNEREKMTYPPGTAEILSFLMALHRHGAHEDATLEGCCQTAILVAGTLAKEKKDIRVVEKLLVEHYGKKL
ncbi:MAG: MoxR family ATPase [Magnetococcus sp. MYC-9]